MLSRSYQKAGAVFTAVLLAACAEPTGTEAAGEAEVRSEAKVHTNYRMPASVEWNEIARGLVAKNSATVFVAFRTYSIASVAQFRALTAAERASSKGNLVSKRAAVAAAAAVALSYVFPADSASLDSILRSQLDSAEWLERDKVDAAKGEEIGRRVGAELVALAKTDGYSDPWTGTVLTGPGKWFSATTPPTPPGGASIADARTWFLTSSDQFRPPPPPEFGSPEFLESLAEVRQISDTRTAEQESIAKFWGMGAGTFTPPGYWNLEASTLAVSRRMTERRAAELLALLNMVAMDAIIASNDAKLAYWLIRPSQVDPAITLVLGLPNFPAYPSNHATISAAMAEVLAKTFPWEAKRLRADADEAALSRVYGGIHYDFDGTAGLELGRRIAHWAMTKGRPAQMDIAAPSEDEK